RVASGLFAGPSPPPEGGDGNGLLYATPSRTACIGGRAPASSPRPRFGGEGRTEPRRGAAARAPLPATAAAPPPLRQAAGAAPRRPPGSASTTVPCDPRRPESRQSSR